MRQVGIGVMLGVAALAAGCEARIGKGDNEATANELASAEGKSEEGQIAFSMPGFDIKINVPLDKAETEQGKILYPGSKVTGLYIAAHPDSNTGSDSEVELRFATPDPPDKVAAWYRDPARAPDFSLSSDGKDGAAFVLAGEEKEDKDGFRLRLEAKGAGTDGRLIVRDRD